MRLRDCTKALHGADQSRAGGVFRSSCGTVRRRGMNLRAGSLTVCLTFLFLKPCHMSATLKITDLTSSWRDSDSEGVNLTSVRGKSTP